MRCPELVKFYVEESACALYAVDGGYPGCYLKTVGYGFCQKCYAAVREILWPHPCHFPSETDGLFETVFSLHEDIFCAQTVEIVFFGAFRECLVEQSGLTEKGGFYCSLVSLVMEQTG